MLQCDVIAVLGFVLYFPEFLQHWGHSFRQKSHKLVHFL